MTKNQNSNLEKLRFPNLLWKSSFLFFLVFSIGFAQDSKTIEGTDIEKVKSVIPEHIKWVREQIDNGTIKQSGKWGESGGITIIQADSIAEVEDIIKKDPLKDLTSYEIKQFFPDVKIDSTSQSV